MPCPQDLRYFKHAILQLAPNGSLAFAHRVWFNKYDPDKDEGRAFDYMTIENSSEGRASSHDSPPCPASVRLLTCACSVMPA